MPGEQDLVIWMRPEQASVGRRAERSRAEITHAAVALADNAGLTAVSMRGVAAVLGTGAASLYRYVSTREDLLDLMTDSTASEYDLSPPTGDWLADLLDVAHQARRIMRRHPWLPGQVIARPILGPAGADLLEHVLDVLADHPATAAAKLEAFALLTAVTALFAQNEVHTDAPSAVRQARYLGHLAAAGDHPRLAALLAAAPAAETAGTDRFDTILSRVLTGLLT